MEYIVGGYAQNSKLIMESAINYFEKRYSKSFYYETITDQEYFILIIREKSTSSKNNLFLVENDVIFKSSYYNQIPDVLLKERDDLNYDRHLNEMRNDLIFIKLKKNKGIKVYIDKFAREKVYYTITNPFLFSTSYRFLISISNKKKLNYDVLIRFLSSGVNISDETFFRNIKRLNFGENLHIYKDEYIVNKYWTLNKDFFNFPIHNINDLKFWEEYIYDVLKETLDFQKSGSIISLMSGGLDSTILTAVLLKEINLPIKALTIEVPGYSEEDVKRARMVAEYLDIPHIIKKLKFNDSSFLKYAYSDIFNILEEPIGGSAFISRYFAYKEAKNIGNENIVVGDGADQVFAYKGKFILRHFKYINHLFNFPFPFRILFMKMLHRLYNPTSKLLYFANNKDFIDAIDVIMKSDFLQSNNQFQSFYCAYQFSNLDNVFKLTNYKIDLKHYLVPLLKNHSIYPFKDLNRIGFNTIIFCANSDNILNKTLADYYDMKLFTPFISDTSISKILPISPKIKMVLLVEKGYGTHISHYKTRWRL